MKLKIQSYILFAFLLLGGSSCKESFLDINTNPNALPTASPNFVFTNAVNQAVANMVSPNETGSYWSGQWTQSNGYILTTTVFSYNFTNGDFNYWDGYYDNLNDYQYVITNADANNQKFLKGPAKVMKALLFQQLVDMYGNVPYSDALKGVGSLAPAFDDQKVIYEGLITSLDEALVDIKANAFASAFTSSDIIFKGNTTKWAKFANSLKLRILMRQARVAGRDAYIKAEINKIVAEGSGFITGEDIASGGPGFYTASAGKLNPVYERWGYSATNAKQALNNYPRLTDFIVKSLIASNDTFRLKKIGYAPGGESTSTPGVSANPEIAAKYVGVPFGNSGGFLPAICSAIGPSLLTKGAFDKPFILMTAAEIQLNLAEAKERFGAGVTLPNDAKTYFDAGMVESFRVLGAGTANAAKFTGINNYDYAASTNKIQAIATQKWLALCNYNGLEAWAEYRKSGFPVTPQSVQITDGKRPVRFFYPNTESGSNADNVAKQGTIDVFATRLFWDID
jgi:hypothetical protein